MTVKQEILARPDYVFTYAGTDGPNVIRFDDADGLLAFVSGWQSKNDQEHVVVIRRGHQQIEVRA